MADIDFRALERAIRDLPQTIGGPGGLAGAVVNGATAFVHPWGFADMDQRLAMTDRLRMPICSISKQFTCAVLFDAINDPERLDDRVATLLPNLESTSPGVHELANMQSGLRDYWAMTVLHGAHPEGRFAREDARRLLDRIRTTQFDPGTSYSYCNVNFRILCELIEGETGRDLGELYVERVFGPAGMETAIHTPDTAVPADGVVGYEGDAKLGYIPAANRIYWTGDAGISASLQDMLAWERHIHTTSDDADSLYCRLSVPQSFRNGRAAPYGFGLVHETVGGRAATGHGGALRGFRLQRLYIPSVRLSVVVLLNHEADAHAAALGIARAALGVAAPEVGHSIEKGWAGDYVVPETGLLLRVETTRDRVVARYATAPDELVLGEDDVARSADMTLTRRGDGLRVERPGEDLRAEAVPITGAAVQDMSIAGLFRSPETGDTMEIVAAGGGLYAGFEGLLGQGPVHALHPLGSDVWAMSCRRSMDAPPPGDWTLRVMRDDAGSVSGLTLGCWLARDVPYLLAE
ncbi:D-aminopeptidase [uncultured Jannaschia sp.]|uniref:D-aminopeptidase n=1 Tax=uncultured Jannaschia sp. TaxID=293347 RepID=UPI002620E746|nr:D-aminopeptidase [uncultured Jannaschia sp.]